MDKTIKDDKTREEFIITIPRIDKGENLDSSLDSDLDSDLVSKDILKETRLILELLNSKNAKRKEILEIIGVTNHSFNAKRFIDPLLDMKLVKRPNDVSPQSPNLKYQITTKGIQLLNHMNKKENK